MKNIPAACLTE